MALQLARLRILFAITCGTIQEQNSHNKGCECCWSIFCNRACVNKRKFGQYNQGWEAYKMVSLQRFLLPTKSAGYLQHMLLHISDYSKRACVVGLATRIFILYHGIYNTSLTFGDWAIESDPFWNNEIYKYITSNIEIL